jgi:hypothetical protein
VDEAVGLELNSSLALVARKYFIAVSTASEYTGKKDTN